MHFSLKKISNLEYLFIYRTFVFNNSLLFICLSYVFILQEPRRDEIPGICSKKFKEISFTIRKLRKFELR